MTAFDDISEAFAESVADVLAEHCNRRSLHHYYDGQNRLDAALWKAAAELGWLGAGLDEDQGGAGLGFAGLDILFRQLGRAAAPGPFLPTLTGAQLLGCHAGRQEAAGQVVERVLAGDAAIALPAKLDRAPMAMRDGRLTGRSVPLLLPADADFALLPVEDGGSGWALLRIDGEAAQVENVQLWDRSRQIGRITCRNVEPVLVLPDGDGTAGDFLRLTFMLAIAADCVGGARAIADQTVAYLKEREQFGRPLASFQALKHRVANLYVAIVEAEVALEQAVESATVGSRSAVLWGALAKASASEAFHFVAEDCLQLHGGVGFTWEFDCHIFLKRALLARELCGDDRAMRDLAAAGLADAAREGRTTAEIAA